MTGVPAPTLYHRWLGWHAPAMRRAITVLLIGLIVAVVLLPFTTWGLAVAGGWDATALAFLLSTWLIIIRADSSRAPQFAARDDQTEGSARVLLVAASVASLLGAGYALHLAGQQSGPPRVLLIGAARVLSGERMGTRSAPPKPLPRLPMPAPRRPASLKHRRP